MAKHVGLKAKLVLPFAVSAEDRIKAFTKDMEMATIFYLAESSRETGEGRILKKPDEKLVFLAEACYPIWLVPWGGATLLFDGLGVTAHTLSYDKLPDVKAFNSDIKRSARTCKAYSTALSRDANYFKNYAGREEKTIVGLITDPDFIRDFLVYLSEAEEKREPSNKALLSPLVRQPEISASVRELSDLVARIDGDAKNLEESMRLLNTKTREKVMAIRGEIKGIRKKFGKRIEKVKPRVTKRVRRIQEKYDKKVSKITGRFERQLQLLHKDRVKLEKTRKRLRAEIKRLEAKSKSRERRKKKRSETTRTRKLEKNRKRLPALKKKIKNVDTKIESLETAKGLEVSKLRTECEVRIEGAMKTLRELEASREARIRIKQPEITSLEHATAQIINQMDSLAKSKRAASIELERVSVPRRRRAYALVHVPFYLVRYERESEKRYDVYPPSVVSGMGMLTKLKGVFGVQKMKCFLQPRSKAITEFLNQLVTLLQKKPMLEKRVTKAGIQASVLRKKALRIGVKKGLKELKKEKWISKYELRTLSRLLFIYTPSTRAFYPHRIKTGRPKLEPGSRPEHRRRD